MVKQIFISLFVILLWSNVHAQEYIKANKIITNTITYSSLQDDIYGKKIMDFIGLQNNTRVSNIKFNIKYRFLITSSASKGMQDLKISLSQISIAGNTVLRKFNIDSLLWPTAYMAKLEIRKNNIVIESINIVGNTTGKLSTTVINNHISNIENTNITVSEIKFYYTEDQYFQVQNLSKKISYYYSYEKLLNILIKEYTNNSQKSSISAEKYLLVK